MPAEDHNPRVKALRAAIRHHAGQRVELSVNGKAVNPLAFDGTRKSADGKIRISTWRGIEIEERTNIFEARILDRSGKLVQQLERKVHSAGSPLDAEMLKDRSILVADGVTRPVIGVRLTDRDGRAARHGLCQ